jgi:hypothetical protein
MIDLKSFIEAIEKAPKQRSPRKKAAQKEIDYKPKERYVKPKSRLDVYVDLKESVKRDYIAADAMKAVRDLLTFNDFLASAQKCIREQEGNARTAKEQDELLGARKWIDAMAYKFSEMSVIAQERIYGKR